MNVCENLGNLFYIINVIGVIVPCPNIIQYVAEEEREREFHVEIDMGSAHRHVICLLQMVCN